MATISRLNRMWARFRDDPLSAATRAVELARAHVLFRDCQRAEGVSATGSVRVVNEGAIRLDGGITFIGGMLATELISHPGASIHLGKGTFVNYGVSIEAFEAVHVGARCLLASFVRIADRDASRRGPVIIEDDVWLAHGVIVEPGVTVGAGSVVSAGSVVTQDVPPGSLASGNPARCEPLRTNGSTHHKESRQWLSSSAS